MSAIYNYITSLFSTTSSTIPFYSRKQVNGRVCANYYPIEPVSTNLWDFDTQMWRKCTQLDNLPYDMGTFALEGETNPDRVTVTSKDSYRLCKNPDASTVVTEEKWRDELYEKAKRKETVELDFLYKSEWHKAKVAWIKEDIVPGVMHIVPRDEGNFWSYVHKDSSTLAPSETHTRHISEEELERERQDRVDSKEKYQKYLKERDELYASLKRYTFRGYTDRSDRTDMEFIDLLPYYQTLKIKPEEVTMEVLNDFLKEKEGSIEPGNFVPAMPYLIFNKNYDGAFSVCKETNKEPGKVTTYSYGDKCDAYADFRVKNATFANYIIRDNITQQEEKFPLKKDGEDFVLGNTVENPIFPAVWGDRFYLQTDGDVEYKAVYIEIHKRRFLYDTHGLFSVSRLSDFGKIQCLGHLWSGSTFLTNPDDLVEIPYRPIK